MNLCSTARLAIDGGTKSLRVTISYGAAKVKQRLESISVRNDLALAKSCDELLSEVRQIQPSLWDLCNRESLNRTFHLAGI